MTNLERTTNNSPNSPDINNSPNTQIKVNTRDGIIISTKRIIERGKVNINLFIYQIPKDFLEKSELSDEDQQKIIKDANNLTRAIGFYIEYDQRNRIQRIKKIFMPDIKNITGDKSNFIITREIENIYERDEKGNITKETEETTTYERDEKGNITAKITISSTYERDEQKEEMVEKEKTEETTIYGRDENGNITKETKETITIFYEYDKEKNKNIIISEIEEEEEISYYDYANNKKRREKYVQKIYYIHNGKKKIGSYKHIFKKYDINQQIIRYLMKSTIRSVTKTVDNN